MKSHQPWGLLALVVRQACYAKWPRQVQIWAGNSLCAASPRARGLVGTSSGPMSHRPSLGHSAVVACQPLLARCPRRGRIAVALSSVVSGSFATTSSGLTKQLLDSPSLAKDTALYPRLRVLGPVPHMPSLIMAVVAPSRGVAPSAASATSLGIGRVRAPLRWAVLTILEATESVGLVLSAACPDTQQRVAQTTAEARSPHSSRPTMLLCMLIPKVHMARVALQWSIAVTAVAVAKVGVVGRNKAGHTESL